MPIPRCPLAPAALCAALFVAVAISAGLAPTQQDQPEATRSAEGPLVFADGQHGFRGFERRVLADFAAAAGDNDALERGLDACRAAVEADAMNAEALAYRGAFTSLRAGAAARDGNMLEAIGSLNEALADLNRARELEPSNPGVLLVRGPVFLGIAPSFPVRERAEQLAWAGIEDTQAGLELLHARWHEQPAERRAQWMLAIAGGHAFLGESLKARDWHNRVLGVAPAGQAAQSSRAWLEADDRRRNSF